jgi:hypothetical protein
MPQEISHSPEGLFQHTKIIHVGTEYSYELCYKMLSSRTSLTYHKKSVHSIGQIIRLECDLCHRMFKSKQNLQQIQLTTLLLLVEHMAYIHLLPQKYSCDIGNKPTKNKRPHHQHVHCNDENIRCDICSKFYKNERSLRSHKWQVHKHSAGKIVELIRCACHKIF